MWVSPANFPLLHYHSCQIGISQAEDVQVDKWFFWVGQGAKTTPISTGAKKEAAAATKIATGTVPVKGGTTAKVAATGGGVSEEEAKALLRQSGPIKSQDLVAKFKSRLKTQEVCLLSLSSHYVICFIGVPQKVSGLNTIQYF